VKFVALYESGQMYLETIYVLKKRLDSVHSIDVAEHLGYSKPSVSRAVGILKSGGYITVEGEGHLSLTEEGTRVAEQLFERHTVLTRLLMSLGIDEETATDDACRIEHVISDTTFDAIKKYLEK
jgi:Mn-dependent DtxR family transcriptional regulator